MFRRMMLLIVGLFSMLSVVGGVGSGFLGGRQIVRARKALKEHAQRYELRYADHLRCGEETNQILAVFGSAQERVQHEVMHRMREFLRRHEKQVRAIDYPIIDSVEIQSNQVQYEERLNFEIESWLRGASNTIIAGTSAPVALRSIVSNTGKASTGRRISTLHGAAADSATRAFLGGGSLAAGGGGIRRGNRKLTQVGGGIGVLLAGLVVKNEGTKAKTQADAQHTLIEDAIARLDLQDEYFRGVQQSILELRDIVMHLSTRAKASLDMLESVPFDLDKNGAQLQESLILVKGIGNILTVPLFDDDGDLHQDSEKLILNYRDIQNAKEPS